MKGLSIRCQNSAKRTVFYCFVNSGPYNITLTEIHFWIRVECRRNCFFNPFVNGNEFPRLLADHETSSPKPAKYVGVFLTKYAFVSSRTAVVDFLCIKLTQ
jgi:hypothetical protein